jgi:broad specificity phosphatase PhoE
VYSSPLSRALDTASAIAAPHGLLVITVDALKEINLGNWEGLTIGEVATRHPDLLAARRRDPLHVAPEGGETIADVHARVLPAVREIAAAHRGESVAVVAHGAVNKAILLSVLGSPLESYGRMALDNAAINVLEWRAGAPRVAAFNEIGHLDGLHEAHLWPWAYGVNQKCPRAQTRPGVPGPAARTRDGQRGLPRVDTAETPAAPPAYTPRRRRE